MLLLFIDKTTKKHEGIHVIYLTTPYLSTSVGSKSTTIFHRNWVSHGETEKKTNRPGRRQNLSFEFQKLRSKFELVRLGVSTPHMTMQPHF